MNIYRPVWGDTTLTRLFEVICGDLLVAPSVNTGHWQAQRDTPMSDTRELTNCVLEIPVHASAGAWASFMEPNLPWAEDHFKERVSGIAHNPPPSHTYWPFNQAENKDHMDGTVFSHTYPERLWPRHAAGATLARTGIRYEYGDLGNAVDILVQEPHTRQCYVPLWFPEDLHATAVEHQRVPCTLGYHFLLRDNHLHTFYPMRSLDWLRYARDDFYMAGRLAQWLIQKCRENSSENSVWHDVYPGLLTVYAVSVHIFEGDLAGVRHKLEKNKKKELA